jgi:hypothetical protein
LRLRAAQKNPVDEESGCAGDADLVPLLHVGRDFGLEFAAIEAGLKRFRIQIQCRCMGDQISSAQLGLVFVQGIVILPKFPLLARVVRDIYVGGPQIP